MARIQERLVGEPNQRLALERERAALTRRVEPMGVPIGDGREPEPLMAEIRKAEARLKELDAALAQLAALSALKDLDLTQFAHAVRGNLAQFVELLQGNVPRVRRALMDLLADQVDFTPATLENGGRPYAFEGRLNCWAVLQSAVYCSGVPRGTQPPWPFTLEDLAPAA